MKRLLWQKFQHIYASGIAVIPLYFRANAYILPNGLTA